MLAFVEESSGCKNQPFQPCSSYLSELRRYPQTRDVKLTIPHLGGLLSFFVERLSSILLAAR
jgi:hypothetical protein